MIFVLLIEACHTFTPLFTQCYWQPNGNSTFHNEQLVHWQV